MIEFLSYIKKKKISATTKCTTFVTTLAYCDWWGKKKWLCKSEDN